MIKNSSYVRSLLIDSVGKAKNAQVGVDLTLNKVSRIGKISVIDNNITDSWKTCGMILNDEKITSELRCAKAAEYIVIEPLVEVDNFLTFTAWHLECGAYSIEFNEGLKPLPANNTAMIINRSSVARSGAMIRSSIYDPGFATPAMGAILYIFTPIIIEKHARVAQIIVFENEDAEIYNGQYMDLPGLKNK